MLLLQMLYDVLAASWAVLFIIAALLTVKLWNLSKLRRELHNRKGE